MQALCNISSKRYIANTLHYFLDKKYLYIKWGLLCNAEDMDSIPGWEIKIPQVLCCDQKKKDIYI